MIYPIGGWGFLIQVKQSQATNTPIPNWIKLPQFKNKNAQMGILYPIGYFLLLVLYSFDQSSLSFCIDPCLLNHLKGNLNEQHFIHKKGIMILSIPPPHVTLIHHGKLINNNIKDFLIHFCQPPSPLALILFLIKLFF